jgi:hypothetical protein
VEVVEPRHPVVRRCWNLSIDDNENAKSGEAMFPAQIIAITKENRIENILLLFHAVGWRMATSIG